MVSCSGKIKPFTIHEMGLEALPLLAQVPCAFQVETIFKVEALEGGMGGLRLREEPVSTPYTKDYDGSADGGPQEWARQFDMRNWGFLVALESEQPIGGAAVAYNTAGVNMLEERGDLAVLWDIRVHPERRGRGLGRQLFQRAGDWARQRGCTQMKIETQNVNVPACRFYARMGCELGSIHRFGYAGIAAVAHEAMLLWYLKL